MKSLSLSRPHALIMVGIPGSGKSHFAQQFSDMFHLPVIEPLEIAAHASSSDASAALIDMFLREIMKSEQSIIVDGSGETQTERAELAQYFASHGYETVYIWVQTDPATAKKRAMRAGLIEDVFHDRAQSFHNLHEKEQPLVISGKHTYVTQARSVLRRISSTARSQSDGAKSRPNTPATKPTPTRPPSGRIVIQ